MKKTTNEELIGFRQKHFLPTPGLYYSKPIQLTKARGCYVWDDTGKKYFDAIGGSVCISSGHNREEIKAAWMGMPERDAIQHTT